MTEEYAALLKLLNERERREAASAVELIGVREYAESYPVQLVRQEPKILTERAYFGPANAPDEHRWVVSATNEGGHNSTSIDLLDLIAWLRANRPDLLESP